MRNYFVFDGVSSKDFGVWISGSGTYMTPPRKYDEEPIPGRNGPVLIDHGTFNTVEVTYPAFIHVDFNAKYDALRAYLSSRSGYKRLEDTYHPEEYRLGYFYDGLNPTMTSTLCGGTLDIRFKCKPQRFLKAGELPVMFTASGTIFNPTYFSSKPLIRVYGTGTITIAGVAIKVNKADGYTDIDCERMDCYKSGVNCNGNVTLTDGKFPELPHGASDIVLSGITRAEITPRWFTI